MRPILEVCVDGPDGLAAAIDGGADRIELCAALELGGLTPSAALMRLAARAPVPVVALIRPRAGDFVYSPAERDLICADIAAARAAGLAGVVVGASGADGRLDRDALAAMAAAARGGELVLHRAVDLAPSVEEAVETAAALGVARILSSGGAGRAVDGGARLATAITAARGRLTVMPGAGITAANVIDLLRRLPVSEIHASCAVPVPASAAAAALGMGQAVRRTDAATVRALKAAMLSAGQAARR